MRGYYALPLLWRTEVIGWANVSVTPAGLDVALGFAGTRPKERAFASALADEVEGMRRFLALEG